MYHFPIDEELDLAWRPPVLHMPDSDEIPRLQATTSKLDPTERVMRGHGRLQAHLDTERVVERYGHGGLLARVMRHHE